MQRLRLNAPPDLVADYFRLFVNRRAYTLQSDRPHPESGRHYYYRPTNKTTGEGLHLTSDTIRRHIEGEITIGLYAINPPRNDASGSLSTRITRAPWRTS